MILTCPECATGYFVDDAAIRPGGRSVRCAACGARWIAHSDRPLELVATAEEGAVAREAQAAETPLTAEDLPKVFRARADNERKVREATRVGFVWGALLLTLILVVSAAIVWRKQIVKALPFTAGTYDAVGLRVNPVGLTIERVHAEPTLTNGHAALSVSGYIQNVEDHVIVAPPLRITLHNGDGKIITRHVAWWTDPTIPAGAKRFFTIAVLDPPQSALDVQADFDLDAKARPRGAAPARPLPAPQPASAPVLRGEAAPEPPIAPPAAAPAEPAPAAATSAPPAAAPPPAAAAPARPSPAPPTHDAGPGHGPSAPHA